MSKFKTEAPEYFKYLPEDRICQQTGTYYEEHPCCVGSHLAFLFGVKNPDDADKDDKLYVSDFHLGQEEYARKLGLTENSLSEELVKHGAADVPFGNKTWPAPPYKVLADMEEALYDFWKGFDEEEYP